MKTVDKRVLIISLILVPLVVARLIQTLVQDSMGTVGF